MSKRFIRDSVAGRLLYRLSQHRLLSYPEESPSYAIPSCYLEADPTVSTLQINDHQHKSDNTACDKTQVSPLLITWDGPDDPENPHNWSQLEKGTFCFLIGFLTLCQYMAAAVYTPMAAELKQEFSLTNTQASLPLALFVVAYGIGPMVMAPLSEMAGFGRNSIYVGSLVSSFVISIPLAFVKNFVAICILRFLSGLFCFAMAIGGASYADLLSDNLYLGQAIWGFSSWLAIGGSPFVGSVLVVKCGWQWVFKFLMIVNGFNLVVFGLFLPETYCHTLLSRKAKRLRVKTGNARITCQGDIESSQIAVSKYLISNLIRPFQMPLVEPVVILINVYITMIYVVVYLWFEAFPIVFIETRQWGIIPMGLTFLSVLLGAVIAVIYFAVTMRHLLHSGKLAGVPEHAELYIHPSTAFLGAIFMPLGVFIFGWTSNVRIHWFPSLVGATCFGFSASMAFQTQMSYLAHAFPRYVASVMGANSFFRSLIGGLICLAAHPLYFNLNTNSPDYPVGWGSTILGFIGVILAFVPLLFYINGPKLRARSEFAN